MTNDLEWTPNCFADLLFYLHNVEVLLNDELKPNSGISSADLPIHMHQPREGVPSIEPALK